MYLRSTTYEYLDKSKSVPCEKRAYVCELIYSVGKERRVGIRNTGAQIDDSCHASERTELRGLRMRIQDSRVAVGRCTEKAG
jgi:hypothetical protein